jgi:membrane protein DedA with SNARE-associated domain
MHNVVRITYPFLLVAVFARQLCLPVPAIFFLMTAGALAGRGELRIGLILAVSSDVSLLILFGSRQDDAGAPES